MARGTVRWFDATEGYGFIEPDDGDQDAFVHITEVDRPGLGPLVEGQRIEFRVREEARGLEAVDLAAER